MKNIVNVVFYKFYGEQGEMEQACLFYEDGTVRNVNLDEAVEAAHQIAREEKIKTKEELKETFNKNRIYVLSGEEFERRFQEFIVKPVARTITPTTTITPSPVITPTVSITPADPVKAVAPVVVPTATITPKVTVTPKKVAKPTTVITPKTITTPKVTVTPTPAQKPSTVIVPFASSKTPPVHTTTPVVKPKKLTQAEKAEQKVVTPSAVPTVTTPKKKNFFQRATEKLKNNKIVRNIALGATALAIALTGYSVGARNTKEGKMVNPFSTTSISSTMLDETGDAYIALLNETKNETQRAAMEHASFLMDNFNTRFAQAYIEEGKDIKAALTWDEMMALNLAYNDYSKEEIVAMFNGAELDATELSHAYRNGTLQLMGAYVIADREVPVNSYLFLRNEEHQNFVKKYEDLFYNCKEAATEEEMIAAVNTFYAELHKDYPISAEVREQGISHGEARRELQPYKLAVTPIVAAAEMMFQNLEIDHTLSDSAIAYFNDLGLCQMADQTFEKAMYISLAAETDKKNPTYFDFKTAKIEELIEEDSYGVADAERDLSQLDRFQYWVNGGYFERFGDRYITRTWTETYTTTWTERTEERTDDRNVAVEKAGEEAVKNAEEQVDQQINKENEQAKLEGEEEAEQTRQEMQEEADREAEDLQDQVEQNDQDLQDRIEDANDTIENGGTVNEEDFGDHNVDFNEQHSDSNGNLNDSVTDITTDGTGAVDSETPLPDPNLEEYDYQATAESAAASTTSASESTSGAETYSSSETSSGTETYENTSGQEIYSYEEEVVLTNEQLVDEYIKSLEQAPSAEEAEVSYTR